MFRVNAVNELPDLSTERLQSAVTVEPEPGRCRLAGSVRLEVMVGQPILGG
jgi:hypothetical protein